MVMRTDRILIADDVAANRALLETLLTRDGYSVETVSDGPAALEAVHREPPDLVISDVLMPRMNGFEVCHRLKQDRATRLIPVILVTSLSERDDRVKGINAGADDFLSKPVDAHEVKARVRSLIRLKRFTDDLDSAESVILSLALTVEARNSYTAGHCQRMAAFAAGFGAHLNLTDEDLDALYRGGYLHDVGKIGIPDAILLKPGPLTSDEFTEMKRHTEIGDALCGNMRLLRLVRPIVRHHHERLDGSGYPDALRGDAIPLLAQVLGIVDVYDALTTDRVYRRAVTPEAACEELRVEAACGWRRKDLVEEFIALLSTGRLAPPCVDHVWAPPSIGYQP
jgi:putative two-component system response regulator